MANRILTLALLVILVPQVITGCGPKVVQFDQQMVKPQKKTSHVIGIVAGHRVNQRDMWRQLVEAKGRVIFREISLGLAIQDELDRRGMEQVTFEEIEIEKGLMLRTLQGNNQKNIDQVLLDRGFGELRLEALCQRTAGLRKLIRSNVEVTQSSTQRMFALIHGKKYPAKIIVTSTLEEVSEALNKINSGELFSTVAATMSIDTSAVRGGEVSPISSADPLWPSSVREVIQKLSVGECSTPILINERWLIITLTGQPIEESASFVQVMHEMQNLSRLAMEQLEIDRLSKVLLTNIRSTIIDQSLKRALIQQ